MPRPDFTIAPSGPFSLRELALFGFGQRASGSFDGVMRLAMCVDGYRAQIGVAVEQDDRGVHCTVSGVADRDVVRAQVARVLSLDHDGEEFVAVGRRDPVIGRLQAAAPGLRPPLFHSPYEAAAWAVLSHRRARPQSAEVRRRLSETQGQVFQVAGQDIAAFPTPARLLEVDEEAGLDATRVARLHGVARAALEGRLDAARIQSAGPAAAMRELQQIPGIGPFYSALIVVRASGLADVLPVAEPISLGLIARLYGLAAPPGPDELDALAQPWRPLRTWAVVLIRAAAHRAFPELGPEPLGVPRRPPLRDRVARTSR